MVGEETAATFFNLSSSTGKANLFRWGGTCLSTFFVSVTINIGLGNRSSISVPIYLASAVIHIIVSIILIKGILSNNRRFVHGWLVFAGFNLILLNFIYFWLILSLNMTLSFAFLAISNLVGFFYWIWTYSFFVKIPLVIEVMFVAAQVHM